MAHIDQLKDRGEWFFRWRSFLPLVIVPLFIIDLRHFGYPEATVFTKANGNLTGCEWL